MPRAAAARGYADADAARDGPGFRVKAAMSHIEAGETNVRLFSIDVGELKRPYERPFGPLCSVRRPAPSGGGRLPGEGRGAVLHAAGATRPFLGRRTGEA